MGTPSDEQQLHEGVLHGSVPEHLQMLWGEGEGGRTEVLEVRNTFLNLGEPRDLDAPSRGRPRSNSWSGSRSSSGSTDSKSSILCESMRQSDGPTHLIWKNKGQDSCEASDNALVSHSKPQQADSVAGANAWAEDDSDDEYQPAYGWSRGSERHHLGQCSPCIRLRKEPGCELGADCKFCHVEHNRNDKKGRNRPCKATRVRWKRMIDDVEEQYKDNPKAKEKALHELVKLNPYMRSLLRSEQARQATQAQASSSQQPGRIIESL